eukprot:TRINITY_DN7362_c0_g1_i1.p2 TRINITY_DN7362_c0_g1~~TRINITY_DN7362_c0_g1_i1.p2  ORF type:complete len:329 (+),score=167.75 TRINITY_DN7362_c0_g1_i1:60-1046(+)
MASVVKRLLQKVDPCTIEVRFKGKSPDRTEDAVTVDDTYEGQKRTLILYSGEEPVAGRVTIKPYRKVGHQGIKVELIGQITVSNDREERIEFTNQCKKYDAEGGEIGADKDYDFEFACTKPYESYHGLNAKVQYFVKVTILRGLRNLSHREELWVHRLETKHRPLWDNSTKASYFKEKDFSRGVCMEVGVDDVLHIEFKYDKKLFHLQECVLGQVTFKIVSLDLQMGEVSLVKREYIGVGDNQFFETETLQKYEIMDGTPIAGEVVPIRFYLNAVPRLTPTYDMVNDTFSVKYYINLVLVTGDGKRYFKQQEIIIYRKPGQRAAQRPG